jgi:hypothetical protein
MTASLTNIQALKKLRVYRLRLNTGKNEALASISAANCAPHGRLNKARRRLNNSACSGDVPVTS